MCIILVGIIFYVAMCPGKKGNVPKGDEHGNIIAEHDTLNTHGTAYARINDSLIKANLILDSINQSLAIGQAKTRSQLDAKTAEVRTYVAQIREINQDTGYFGHLLDSLQQQVESLSFLVVQYEAFADSINNVNDSVKINYDAMVKEKDKRLAELQSAYDKLYKAYIALFDTTTGLMKNLKRQKLKTKIVAVLGLAAGAAAVLK